VIQTRLTATACLRANEQKSPEVTHSLRIGKISRWHGTTSKRSHAQHDRSLWMSCVAKCASACGQT